MASATSKKSPFFTPFKELNMGEVGTRLGTAGAAVGADIGLSRLSTIEFWADKPDMRKAMGPVSAVLGLAGVVLLNHQNTFARVLQGAALGMATWGLKDTAFTLLWPDAKASYGLSGLPEDSDGGTNWAAVLEMVDQDAQLRIPQPGQAPSLQGVPAASYASDVPFGGSQLSNLS
jgi:hypothetical protein